MASRFTHLDLSIIGIMVRLGGIPTHPLSIAQSFAAIQSEKTLLARISGSTEPTMGYDTALRYALRAIAENRNLITQADTGEVSINMDYVYRNVWKYDETSVFIEDKVSHNTEYSYSRGLTTLVGTVEDGKLIRYSVQNDDRAGLVWAIGMLWFSPDDGFYNA